MPKFRVWLYETREAVLDVEADDKEMAFDAAWNRAYDNPKLWHGKDGSHEVQEITGTPSAGPKGDGNG